MAKRIIWSERAKRERRRILGYWEEVTGNKRYSKKLARHFNNTVTVIANHNFGRDTEFPGVRKALSAKYYLIYYKATLSTVEIFAIWDGRRNPANLKLG